MDPLRCHFDVINNQLLMILIWFQIKKCDLPQLIIVFILHAIIVWYCLWLGMKEHLHCFLNIDVIEYYCISNSDLCDVFHSLCETIIAKVQSYTELRKESFDSLLKVVLFDIITCRHFTPLGPNIAEWLLLYKMTQ